MVIKQRDDETDDEFTKRIVAEAIENINFQIKWQRFGMILFFALGVLAGYLAAGFILGFR